MNAPAQLLPGNPIAAADQLRSLSVDLERQEAVIERGLQSFLDVGRALATIRDDRLYRQEFSSFEVYCQQRWQLSRPRAYQLIDAATVVAGMEAAIDVAIDSVDVSTKVDTPLLPANERQARQLVGLEPDDAADVMRRAAEATDGKPTASAIRDARQQLSAPPEPTVADCIHCGDTLPLTQLYEGGQGYECDPCVSPEPVAEQELPPLPENRTGDEPAPAPKPITGYENYLFEKLMVAMTCDSITFIFV